MKNTNPFKVGDLAGRIDKDLDARPVSRVDGEWIKLQIGDVETDWLEHYLYRRIVPAS